MRIVRSILALFAGCLAAGVLTAVCESLGHVVFPPPPGLDLLRIGPALRQPERRRHRSALPP